MIVVRGVPIYWGIETPDEGPWDYRLVCRSYMREVLPPYRQSTRGIRIRVSHRHWLHLGTFEYDKEPNKFGFGVDPNAIGRWSGGQTAKRSLQDQGAPAAQEQPPKWAGTPLRSPGEQVGSIAHTGSRDSSGIDTWTPGRVVAGPDVAGSGHGVGAGGDGDADAPDDGGSAVVEAEG